MSYLDLDFKSRQAQRQRPPQHKAKAPIHLNRIIRGFTALITLIASVYLILSFLPDSSAKVGDSNLKLQRLHYSVLLPGKTSTEISQPSVSEEVDAQPESQWKTIQVKAGDTLASIFSNAGLSASTTHQVVQLNKQTKKLSKIRPGQNISILQDSEGTLINLKYMPSLTQTLVIKRQQDKKLTSELLHHPLDPIPVFKSGEITSSLFLAAEKSNIPESVIMELAGIFGWDIDFALDIRKGDQFAVVYNELFKDGEKIRNGRILSAEFINQGKQYKAVYYTDPKGESSYYSPDGKSMRKAFLRSPVKFSRISSRFKRNRKHPVLSKTRAHKGVDYAASRGTPIRASGDGKIKYKGTKGGYGKTIYIQHGGKYTTVYAHMSRYARGSRKGKRVKQGQIIGYVGSTGLATGPHLHYEFRVHGVHRNPLTVKLPAAEPIDKAYRAHFKKETRTFLSMLNLMDEKKVAQVTQ
ncbi:MAG: peptidoglycan DD-metalloendopeptidase family protein [Gammaproteobacteria bacterium]|jgi:murein DD-endopeptidase MepM/ murein hydrolase activator NlpD|nr:peptidoglycan DD-metalloendopeptidase family protein [Gammaproteobacteria bacterium]MBT3725781.1 peptidoglycan DD-metalloendopeptidase family protein [Gammaproteobacteria bacterium]MBT4077502.1 peptidoglycan DD-metalloendopeptidase family protein [Gammaproteobacteria bacterium]MBT4196049.1 peptidoglycan DD-metalloendopeptidase family protein [Gammaproteobacteria bacterium]MBT4448796.1 peptidoglycan DD-metalloendopeptidase family protein [Gammaproteobacteria bacterium]